MFILKGFLDFLTIFFRRPKFFGMITIILFSVFLTISIYSSRVVEHIPVYVADMDNSMISRTLREFLESTPDISVQGYIDNLEEAQDALINGEVAGVILIPPGLSQSVKTQQQAKVKVFIDGSNIVEARNIDRVVQTIVKSTSVGISLVAFSKQGVKKNQLMPLTQPINLDVEKPFNPLTIYTDYLLPVLIFFNLWLFICLMVNAAFQEEPSEKISSHKIRRRFYYLGRMLAIGLIAFILGILIYAKGLPQIDIVLSSSPVMALSSLLVFIVLTILLYTLVNLILNRARLMAMTVSCLFCMCTLMVSGLTWPLEMIPWYLREFATWMPLTPFLSSVQVFLYHKATWSDLYIYYGMFLKQAILYTALIVAVMLFKDFILFCRYIYHRRTKKQPTPSLIASYPELVALAQKDAENNKDITPADITNSETSDSVPVTPDNGAEAHSDDSINDNNNIDPDDDVNEEAKA